MKNNNIIFTLLLLCTFGLAHPQLPQYYCSPSDHQHYHLLKNLIGSIHHTNFDSLAEIAVFDLGLLEEEKKELETMEKIKIYQVEMVNPDLLTDFVTSTWNRKVKGFFAWKPVILKQMLDIHPYVLYLDSGTTVLQSLDILFDYINQKGYFLLSCSVGPQCNIVNRITKKVKNLLVDSLAEEKAQEILADSTIMIDAGIQGISRAMLTNYVDPMYQYAHDLTLFEDDGSAPWGFGEGRHDQTLFSILAHTLNLIIYPEGFFELNTSNETRKIHMHWDGKEVNEKTILYHSRHDIQFNGGSTQYIRYKN